MDQRRLALRLWPLVRGLLFALPLLFLVIFFLYPLASILRVGLLPTGRLDATIMVASLRQPFLGQVIWFTIWQAALSTLLTLLLGLPLAYFFAHYDFRGKTVAQALLTIPFVMPTVVVSAAFVTLLGDKGLINQWLQGLLVLDEPPIQILQTIWIILLAHAFYNVSIVVRTVGGFWANLSPTLQQAAAVLGASPWQVFGQITLPLLLPSIIAASLLIFLFCFTSFGVVLILGGLKFATLEVEIYRQAVSLFNLPVAAFLCLVQMALTFLMMYYYTRLQAMASVPLEMRPAQRVAHRLRTWPQRLALGCALLVALAILLAPLLALALRSFSLGDEGVTLHYYQELTVNRRQSAFFVPPVVAIRNSLLFAGVTMLFSLLLGILSAYWLARPQRWLVVLLDPIFLLPLGTSAVTLGFGYILAMGPLRTSLWLTPVAHTLIAAPFVMRTFLPALRRLDPQLRESAAVMGASPWRTWWEIDVPLLYRAVLVSAVFAFTISLGEFGATLLVSRPDTPTMPMVIYRLLGQPGLLNFGQALAMSTLLMAVTALAVLVIERLRPQGVSEF
jgi:thiamine transport system permease protein